LRGNSTHACQTRIFTPCANWAPAGLTSHRTDELGVAPWRRGTGFWIGPLRRDCRRCKPIPQSKPPLVADGMAGDFVEFDWSDATPGPDPSKPRRRELSGSCHIRTPAILRISGAFYSPVTRITNSVILAFNNRDVQVAGYPCKGSAAPARKAAKRARYTAELAVPARGNRPAARSSETPRSERPRRTPRQHHRRRPATPTRHRHRSYRCASGA
jgi:hypothetical protein